MSTEPTNPTGLIDDSLTLPDVVREVMADFAGFAKRHLAVAVPPAMMLVGWMLGMDGVAGALDIEHFGGRGYPVDNWFHAWLAILIAGIPAAVVRYWFGGMVFHGVVRIAGGHGPARMSRRLFLYGAIPLIITDLVVKIVQMIAYGNAYFGGQTKSGLDAFLGGLLLAAFLWTGYLLFVGMTRVQGAERRRSILAIVGIALLMMALTLGLAG